MNRRDLTRYVNWARFYAPYIGIAVGVVLAVYGIREVFEVLP